MINPNQILNVGPNQEFVKFNGSWCTNEDMSIPRITNTVIESSTSTTPKYTNSINKYSQKLILPVNNSLLVEDYSESHFGHEVKSTSNSKIVYASGKGKVIISGKDSLLGNVVIIKYDDVYDIKTNSVSCANTSQSNPYKLSNSSSKLIPHRHFLIVSIFLTNFVLVFLLLVSFCSI